MSSDVEPTLTIIVVSYNTRDMTLDCLRSVYAETRETPFELIVVDNLSSDGSADAIADVFPQVDLIRSEENLGFARANNLAAERARGDYLLLLNPDTIVLHGAIDRLMDFARRTPEAQIWGGRTIFADGSVNRTSCYRKLSLWQLFTRVIGLSVLFPASDLFNGEGYGRWDRDTEREVDVVTGCFFLLPTALWRRLGGFDARFVMFGEENDLCLRAKAVGARPRVTPDSEIIHYGGASEKIRAERLVRVFRGKITLIFKHWGWPARPIGRRLFEMWPYSRKIVTGLAAPFAAKAADSHDVWSEVWRRREEWRSGYPLDDAT